jgi:quercetin dioxygenase-like cupin family protein
MPYVAEQEVVAPGGATLEEIAAGLGRAPWRQPIAASPALRAVLWGWPAGFATVPHRHPRAEELFLVVSGRAAFGIEGEPERILGPGGVTVAPRDATHEIRVLEGDPFVMLIVLGPNEDAPDETIEQPAGRPQPGAGPT